VKNLQEIVESPIAVACHDAGAANLIVHWLKNYEGIIYPCMEGPAIRIWNFYFPTIEILSIDEAIRSAKTLLSGTGNSNFEHNARIKAQNKGLYSVSVIDHWTSYKERFVFNNQAIFPDLILVSDRYAKQLAQNTFPLVKVEELRNLYLENAAKLALEKREKDIISPPRRILAVMENFQKSFHVNESLCFKSLDYLIDNIYKVNNSKDVILRIRPHPSDKDDKYEAFIQKHNFSEVIKNQELYEDLAWADLVVGMQSFAMVVSLHSEIPTMSILPPDSIECILPFEKILHLKDL